LDLQRDRLLDFGHTGRDRHNTTRDRLTRPLQAATVSWLAAGPSLGACVRTEWSIEHGTVENAAWWQPPREEGPRLRPRVRARRSRALRRQTGRSVRARRPGCTGLAMCELPHGQRAVSSLLPELRHVAAAKGVRSMPIHPGRFRQILRPVRRSSELNSTTRVPHNWLARSFGA
jgi:hypothetical protein